MSNVILSPSRLAGEVTVPPSKSVSHRAILCAVLARGRSRIRNLAFSRDILATLNAARSLGVSVRRDENGCVIDSSGELPGRADIDCGESGSTLRFLIPVLGALGVDARLTGHGRLPGRPLGAYRDCLPPHGVRLESAGGLPLRVGGKLEPGTYLLPGGVSSQFVTGLLLALPLLGGDSEIRLTSPLESAGYVSLTVAMLADFGVRADRTEDGWHIPGGQRYAPQEYEVEGDWSQAAFFLAAGALGGDLSIRGLRRDSVQGDRMAEVLFTNLGAVTGWENDVLRVRGGRLRGMEIDAAQIPDLVPALAAAAALAEGRTVISRAGRLRLKESDRLEAMERGLSALGGKIAQTPDGLVIDGVERLRSGHAEGYNDHRVVMALSAAALRGGRTELTDAQSVAKSYPDFFGEYNRLGGKANVI